MSSSSDDEDYLDLEKIEAERTQYIQALINKMINREIDCHKFLQMVETKYVGYEIEVMNELDKHAESDECVICFKKLYCDCKSNDMLKYDYYAEKTGFSHLKEIKTRAKELIRAESPRLDLISILYHAPIDRYGKSKEYFRREQLQYAADNGDSYAAYLIAFEYEKRLDLWRRQKNITQNPEYQQMIKYYRLAGNSGNRLACKRLAELYYDEGEKNLEQIKELYLKCDGFHDIIYDDEDRCHMNHALYHSLIMHLIDQVKEKEVLINELIYEPGGRGYKEAKESFEQKRDSF